MAADRPITDFVKKNDRYAQSRKRFSETEVSSLIVKDVYEGLERYNCCYCGHFCAILDAKLEILPKRSTDNSTAVARKHMLKQRFKEGELKRLKRKKGIETQYRMCCPGCGLFVAYRSSPTVAASKYIYVCEAALTQKATVLHVDGSDQLSAGVISTAMVPKSVQNGKEAETVKLVVRLATGKERTCVNRVTDEAVFVDLEIAEQASEAEVNAELRRYISTLLDRVRFSVPSVWPSFPRSYYHSDPTRARSFAH